jgi:hypothetical protein
MMIQAENTGSGGLIGAKCLKMPVNARVLMKSMFVE